jgi:hypothetical protein
VAPSLTVPPPTVTSPPATLTPSLAPTLTSTPPAGFSVRYHPDGGLYVGDHVSLEIIAPPQGDLDLNESQVSVSLPAAAGTSLGETGFGHFGIGGRRQATLTWVWDTSDLEAGAYSLAFSIQTLGITWQQTVVLQPESALSPALAQAQWAVSDSDCCLVYYVTETAGARDLPLLLDEVDAQAQAVAALLSPDFSQPITITLLPRVLGHGGFASGEIAVSYLDRNYAGSDIGMVLHHELVHVLDGQLGGEYHPSILVEGLAVYLTGGHFKPEPLIPRAAALLDPDEQEAGLGLGWYLPLEALSNDFYQSQHEIGYLQAGALVEYMVETWGWEAFSDFYGDIQSHPSGEPSRAIDAALRQHFALSFAQLEERFLDALRQQVVTPDLYDDVRLTVEFYDTARRYQQALDPSAYFLTAWLPSAGEMRERGIVADYLRHPTEIKNLTLEMLLVTADEHLRAGRYAQSERSLDAVNAVLDARDQGAREPFGAHPLAETYYSIADTLVGSGYQPQRVQISGGKARVWVSAAPPEVIELEVVLVAEDWQIMGD